MDQRARDVQEDLKNIDRTRAALDEKLQLLDHRIKETFRETRAATLEVLELAGEKAARRPLTLAGGVVALALLARWIDRRHREGGVHPYFPSKAQGADVMPDDGHTKTPRGVYPFFPDAEYRRVDRRRPRPMLQAVWKGLSEDLRLEGVRIRHAALHAGRSFLHDLIHIAGTLLIEQLRHLPARRAERRRHPERLSETRRLT